MAQAAGEFLNERLFASDLVVDPDIRTKRGKRRLENTQRLRDLVTIPKGLLDLTISSISEIFSSGAILY